MTAHTVPVTASGATIAVSASIPATYDAAGYGATIMVYTAIGNVSDHGAHGVTAAITKFTPVDTATVSKVKGSKDYGSKSLKIANIAGDAGQVIMKAERVDSTLFFLHHLFGHRETLPRCSGEQIRISGWFGRFSA